MIDITLLRNNQEEYTKKIHKKDPTFDVAKLCSLDQQMRQSLISVEHLRQQKNDCAQQAKKGINEELRQKSIDIGKSLKSAEDLLENVQKEFDALYLRCPNIPSDDVPEGNKESNRVVKTYGQKPTFSFPVKDHLELGQRNEWFDLAAATKMAASGFVMYKKDGLRLLYALAMFMLKNNRKHGFEMVLPPYVASEETLTVSGNFPKFKEDVFTIGADNLYMIPTSEVCLASLYRDDILKSEQLPIRLTSWTSCFRREAGNYGKMERGLIRIHQFEKVELVSLCKPQDSYAELDRMVACAESILQQLGLHYQISLLAAQDCSFQSAKTFDIEVWLPGQNRYYEVSSASNCTDFQARRGKIRYREDDNEKTQLVHTLNASSLALPRLMVALMETCQQSDGSIVLPEVILKEMI